MCKNLIVLLTTILCGGTTINYSNCICAEGNTTPNNDLNKAFYDNSVNLTSNNGNLLSTIANNNSAIHMNTVNTNHINTDNDIMLEETNKSFDNLLDTVNTLSKQYAVDASYAFRALQIQDLKNVCNNLNNVFDELAQIIVNNKVYQEDNYLITYDNKSYNIVEILKLLQSNTLKLCKSAIDNIVKDNNQIDWKVYMENIDKKCSYNLSQIMNFLNKDVLQKINDINPALLDKFYQLINPVSNDFYTFKNLCYLTTCTCVNTHPEILQKLYKNKNMTEKLGDRIAAIDYCIIGASWIFRIVGDILYSKKLSENVIKNIAEKYLDEFNTDFFINNINILKNIITQETYLKNVLKDKNISFRQLQKLPTEQYQREMQFLGNKYRTFQRNYKKVMYEIKEKNKTLQNASKIEINLQNIKSQLTDGIITLELPDEYKYEIIDLKQLLIIFQVILDKQLKKIYQNINIISNNENASYDYLKQNIKQNLEVLDRTFKILYNCLNNTLNAIDPNLCELIMDYYIKKLYNIQDYKTWHVINKQFFNDYNVE